MWYSNISANQHEIRSRAGSSNSNIEVDMTINSYVTKTLNFSQRLIKMCSLKIEM